MKLKEMEESLVKKAAEDNAKPAKESYRSPVIHTTCPPELIKRMRKCLETTDMESQSQFVRVAIKRLCAEIEKRKDGIDKAMDSG